MHPDDFEELSELGFGFAWAGIVELFREAHNQTPVHAGSGTPRSERGDLAGTTRCVLRADWMVLRSN